jgi:hypothetical protein
VQLPRRLGPGQRPLARLQHFQLSAFQCFRFPLLVHPAYFPVFFWSLLIFLSFWGYGEILRRRIDRPEFADLGWGLTAAWGMAIVLALGGLLMAFRLAKAPGLPRRPSAMRFGRSLEEENAPSEI